MSSPNAEESISFALTVIVNSTSITSGLLITTAVGVSHVLQSMYRVKWLTHINLCIIIPFSDDILLKKIIRVMNIYLNQFILRCCSFRRMLHLLICSLANFCWSLSRPLGIDCSKHLIASANLCISA